MTNFALILNDLAASFEGRNEYISRLCRYPLLILDDFGMERGTEYGLEQVFNVIDSRYRSGKPLIVTTTLRWTTCTTRRTPPIPGFMTGCFPCASRYALPATTSGRKPPSGNGEHEETDYRLKGVLPMADNKQHDTRTTRRPDCVTESAWAIPSLSCPAISRKTPQPQPPTKWRGYWKRKPLLHRSRLIRREPGHGKAAMPGSVAVIPLLQKPYHPHGISR